MKLVILTFGIAAAVPATIQTDSKQVIASGEPSPSPQAKSVEKVLVPKDGSPTLCATAEDCRAQLVHRGYMPGAVGYPSSSQYDFSGNFGTKGCYAYKLGQGGTYEGYGFFGEDGTVEDQQRQDLASPKMRIYCSDEVSEKFKKLWDNGYCHATSQSSAGCCDDVKQKTSNVNECGSQCEAANKDYFLFGNDGQCICTEARCTKDNEDTSWDYYEINQKEDFVHCIDTSDENNHYGKGNDREVCPLGCYRKCVNHGCTLPGSENVKYYDCEEGPFRSYDHPDLKTAWTSTSDCCEPEDKLYGTCGSLSTTCK